MNNMRLMVQYNKYFFTFLYIDRKLTCERNMIYIEQVAFEKNGSKCKYMRREETIKIEKNVC
jgi:hypothetical protein